MQDENVNLARRLGAVYAKLLGERERLLTPPKYVTRSVADKRAYEAEEGVRHARVAEIEAALPHFIYVLKALDPEIDERQIRPIRPKRRNHAPMPNGIAGTAMDIVREAHTPLAPSEIVAIMGERFDLNLSTVRERQRYYDAINHAFMGSYRHDLIQHPGLGAETDADPGWRRRWSWKHSAPTKP